MRPALHKTWGKILLLAVSLGAASVSVAAEPLLYIVVKASPLTQKSGFDGKVEAVRHTQMAAQVGGTITQVDVKAGDTVRSGQVLVRLDGRAAVQTTTAAAAQTQAARAALAQAQNNLTRKRTLFAKGYISKAAMDMAQAEYNTAQAQVNALSAQTSAAQTQSSFYTLTAPYDGVLAEVNAQQGQTALPGMPLLTVYDPSQLRVSAHIPASAIDNNAIQTSSVEVSIGNRTVSLQPSSVQVLPAVDPRSMSREVRAILPQSADAIVPGMFARLILPNATAQNTTAHRSSITIPQKALVRRAEVTSVYVLNAQSQPLLRQVRIGAVQGEQIEILSGLDNGDRVAIDPQAATRLSH